MDITSKTTLIMMINKTGMIVLTMMISAMMIRGARIWEHLRGGGRLHYLAGSARAERRGQPGCSTPPHRYSDEKLKLKLLKTNDVRKIKGQVEH